MVFNATFNNISVKSWRSVLFVEETRVPRENNTIGEQFPEEKTTIEKSYIFQGENYISYRFHGRNE